MNERRSEILKRYASLRHEVFTPPYYLDSNGEVPFVDNEYDGQVALVVGGSKGIGAAVARKMAGLGARAVVINSRESSRSQAEALVTELATDKTSVLYVPGDITLPETWTSLIRQTVDAFGQLDQVVLSAGTRNDGLFPGMDYDKMFSVMMTNYFAPAQIAREAAKQMREQARRRMRDQSINEPHGGSIVFVSSAASRGSFGQTNYAASKGADNSLVLSAAEEFAGRGVNFIAVAPGPVRTDMTKDLSPELIAALLRKTKSDYVLPPEEVGDHIAYLASPLRGPEVNGQIIPLFGFNR